MSDTVVEASERFMRVSQRLPSIFDLDDQMCAILALIEDAESSGEEPTNALETQLALVETALSAKVEGYVSVIRTLTALHDARKGEADRLRARAATAERAADWLKERLLVHLKTTGQTHIETPRFTIGIRQNPPRVEVLLEEMVPKEYVRTVVTTAVDKRGILADFKQSGVIPPGCEIVRGERISIS